MMINLIFALCRGEKTTDARRRNLRLISASRPLLSRRDTTPVIHAHENTYAITHLASPDRRDTHRERLLLTAYGFYGSPRRIRREDCRRGA